MWYTNIHVYTCSNIIENQKKKGISIKVGCATRSLHESTTPKAEESRLTIRGDRDQTVTSEEV